MQPFPTPPPQQPYPPQSPSQRPARLDADTLKHYWNRGVGTRVVMVGAVVLILMCACCGVVNGISGAIAGSAATGGTDGSQQQGQQQQGQATAGPTATPRATTPPTATPKPKAWTTIIHFGGSASGTKTFDTFHLQNGDHLVWNTTVHSSANLFIASLYRQGESYGHDLPYQDITSIANGDSQGDTITIQGESADVYLWVQADNVTWTVDIQRFQ